MLVSDFFDSLCRSFLTVYRCLFPSPFFFSFDDAEAKSPHYRRSRKCRERSE